MTVTTYKELKKRFRSIGLGVVRTGGFYHVYFLSGIQRLNTLSSVSNLRSLEELLKINHG